MGMLKLQGLRALVTGASRGIGKAVALALADEGVSLALCARGSERLDRVCGHVKSMGGVAAALEADLMDFSQAQALAPRAAEALGGLDIVINNAGIAQPAPLAETALEVWDAHMALNARAPFLICQAALPALRKSNAGCIVNIASVVGIKGYANQGAYTASKHALMGFTKVLAQEVQADGIRVHAVCPGGVATDMVMRTRPDLDIAGLATPEEIAQAVLFLLCFRGNAVIDQLDIRRASNTPWK